MKFDKKGLIPVIIQDINSKEVLMLGYMNREAYELTLETKRVWFYSRSRSKLWMKGETSGNYLNMINMQLDCDKDAILIQVRPNGSTCHTGKVSCFYNKVHGKKEEDIIDYLEKLIKDRIKTRTENSYIAKLINAGFDRSVQKFGEEAVETIIAFKNDAKEEMVNEGADLFFHFLVMIQQKGLDFSNITSELQRRVK